MCTHAGGSWSSSRPSFPPSFSLVSFPAKPTLRLRKDRRCHHCVLLSHPPPSCTSHRGRCAPPPFPFPLFPSGPRFLLRSPTPISLSCLSFPVTFSSVSCFYHISTPSPLLPPSCATSSTNMSPTHSTSPSLVSLPSSSPSFPPSFGCTSRFSFRHH